jgi:hypothetical protein
MTDQPRLKGHRLARAYELWTNGTGWRTDQIAKVLHVSEASVYNSVFHAYATDATVVPFRKVAS